MSEEVKKRNAQPDQVRVLQLQEFDPEESLDSRTQQILDNRYEVLIHNLDLLMEDCKSQREFCEVRLEDSPTPSQLSTFRMANKDISYHHIVRIATACGLTPEQLTGQLLDQPVVPDELCACQPARPLREYRKYAGTYHMAYFRTDSKPGQNRRDEVDSLSFGMMTVLPPEPGSDPGHLRVVAFSNCTAEEQQSLERATAGALQQNNLRGVYTCYEKLAQQSPQPGERPRMKLLYKGELTLTERVAQITLRQCQGVDEVHISLPNRAAVSSHGHDYHGGLGAMMSTSRGGDHLPCGQSVILSRKGFDNVALEEIAHHLFLEPPEVQLHREASEIIAYLKLLFPEGDADSPTRTLSLSDREDMLAIFIERKIAEAMKRNFLCHYKVSKEKDEFVYKKMCR